MSKATQIILSVAAVVLVGVFGYQSLATKLGGDFAGGVTPTQLFTPNVSTGGITPVGNLSIGFGGTAAANQITALYTATTAYPSAIVNLGSILSSTSTTSTVVSFTASGFSVGDACNVAYNGASTTGAFGADSFVTAVSGNNISATVTFWNGLSSVVPLNVTSTATGVSSTLKTTCFHTGV